MSAAFIPDVNLPLLLANCMNYWATWKLLDIDGSNMSHGLFDLLRKAIKSVSEFLLTGAPKNIGREEFLLLLLRKAAKDDEIAGRLNLSNPDTAKQKLVDLEKEILKEEVNDPKLPANIWRTRAMNTVIPDLASKIFSRFDELMDRIEDNINFKGKLISIFITFPLLLAYWPIDAVELINRLNNDKILSAKAADLAQGTMTEIKAVEYKLSQCRDMNPVDDDVFGTEKDPCRKELENKNEFAINKMAVLNKDLGLFTEAKNYACKTNESLIDLDCVSKRAKAVSLNNLSPGIFITWILVSMGSAFWLGVLNKMLGIRSEYSKKLQEQRESRVSTQQ